MKWEQLELPLTETIESDEEIIPAPRPLPTDEEGNPIDYSYKGMMKESKKHREKKEFKDKIRSVGFLSIPGGVRNKP